MCKSSESGVVLIAMVAVLVPLVLTVAVFTSMMTGRTDRLMDELDQERALLVAESGVDFSVWLAQIGYMDDGLGYEYTVGPDARFSAKTTHLHIDGIDNDGDGDVDESDEDVFQVVVTGSYRDVNRRLAAYLGPVPLLPPLDTPVALMNPDPTIELRGSSGITGHDTNIDGSPGPGPSQHGLSIASPGTVADLMDELTGSESNRVDGLDGTPSLGTTAAIDLPTVVAGLQNAAHTVLTSDQYSSFTYGTPASPQITYRDGDVRFTGNTEGAGILVVTGNLELRGNARFYGVIVVLGDLDNSAGNATVYGSVIQGPGGTRLEMRGTSDVFFSSEAIALANSAGGQYVAFNGWQELRR